MSQSPYSFTAYIDESGDEGFVFAPPPDHKSSEWFVLSAAIYRNKWLAEETRTLSQKFQLIKDGGRIHFSELDHPKKVAAIDAVSNSRVVTSSVCYNKPALDLLEHTLKYKRRLYFFSVRLLLERVSWYVRDHAAAGEGNGQVQLVFSRSKNLSYNRLKAYLALLRARPRENKIDWPSIDTEHLEVLQHYERVGLMAVDAVACGIRCALELSPYGFCEDRFVLMLAKTIYKRNRKYFSYGLKFQPEVPQTAPGQHDRYAWVDRFR